MERPKTSILNPAFKWTPAEKTNIAKTFARIRREMAKAEPQKATVTPIKERKKAL